MIEKDFVLNEFLFTRYQIEIRDNLIWIKYFCQRNDFKGDPNDQFYHFCLDIRNIPELIKGIMQVFYGEYGITTFYEIKDNNDDISMSCNYEMVSPSEIYVRNRREDLNLEGPYFKFVFNPNQVPTHPVEARIPTPAMVWVTDTLKKVYDDWNDKFGGAVER